MDSDGTVLEEYSYNNRHDEATKFVKDSKVKYIECQAVCESTRNHWIKTADALEKVGIPLELANPFKAKVIAWASIKNDKVDARTLAHLLRSDLVASCYIGNSKSRGKRQLIRHAIRLVHDRTRVINSLHSLTDKYDVDPKNGGSSVWRARPGVRPAGSRAPWQHESPLLSGRVSWSRPRTRLASRTTSCRGIAPGAISPRGAA